ncbi:hypothetical protein BDR07DRAFT_34876 [Suillus spraguei]|nr:hypothetical protein BDR07DRAFT_34876 [Suillus spraguei]
MCQSQPSKYSPHFGLYVWLWSIVSNSQSLGREWRFQLLRDIIAGLQYLHANNVIHGDFTGPNVLIHGDGTALPGRPCLKATCDGWHLSCLQSGRMALKFGRASRATCIHSAVSCCRSSRTKYPIITSRMTPPSSDA